MQHKDETNSSLPTHPQSTPTAQVHDIHGSKDHDDEEGIHETLVRAWIVVVVVVVVVALFCIDMNINIHVLMHNAHTQILVCSRDCSSRCEQYLQSTQNHQGHEQSECDAKDALQTGAGC